MKVKYSSQTSGPSCARSVEGGTCFGAYRPVDPYLEFFPFLIGSQDGFNAAGPRLSIGDENKFVGVAQNHQKAFRGVKMANRLDAMFRLKHPIRLPLTIKFWKSISELLRPGMSSLLFIQSVTVVQQNEAV